MSSSKLVQLRNVSHRGLALVRMSTIIIRHSSSEDKNITDKFAPGIRSPFENPNRIKKDVGPNLTQRILEAKVIDEPKYPKSGLTHEPHLFETPKTVDVHQISHPEASALGSISKLHSEVRASAETSQPKLDENPNGDGPNQPVSDDQIQAIPRAEQVARNTRIGMYFLLGGTTIGLIWFCFHYGRAKRGENGEVIPDSYSGSLLAPFYRIGDGFRDWLNYAVEPAREKLLPDPLKPPYIQPKYTLVIEMKNVLVSPEWTYKTGYRFKKRPALEYFLDVVGYPNFELVIYTSEPPMSAFSVIDNIDTKQRIMYRLFRDCTKYVNGHHVKDLNRLNRDLSKVIFIDFDPQSAKYNPENMLRLPKWDGDMNDTSLVDLAELLKTIYLSDVDDVRPVLQFYSAYDNPTSEFRRRAIELAEKEKRAKEQAQSQSTLRKYAGFFGLKRHNV